MLVNSASNETMENYPSFVSQVSKNMIDLVNANSQGYFNSILHTQFQKPGKMIRIYLAYRLGSLLGTPVDQLAAWASACELLHNATLIHDDLQDRDTHRRGKLSFWAQHGEKQAINAGDFLMLSALQPVLLSSIPSHLKVKLSMMYSQMSCKIANGQSLEFEMNESESTAQLYDQYIDCISLKTAALFSDLAVGVNALSLELSFEDYEIYELFSKLGILFQMQDDIIDLYGDKKRDAKGCDVKEGKISFLIAMHTRHHPQDFETLAGILRKPRFETTVEDIARVELLFRRKRTLMHCLEEANSLKKEILEHQILQTSTGLKHLVEDMLNQVLGQPLEIDEQHA